MQLVYSTAPTDWAKKKWVFLVLLQLSVESRGDTLRRWPRVIKPFEILERADPDKNKDTTPKIMLFHGIKDPPKKTVRDRESIFYETLFNCCGYISSKIS